MSEDTSPKQGDDPNAIYVPAAARPDSGTVADPNVDSPPEATTDQQVEPPSMDDKTAAAALGEDQPTEPELSEEERKAVTDRIVRPTAPEQRIPGMTAAEVAGLDKPGPR